MNYRHTEGQLDMSKIRSSVTRSMARLFHKNAVIADDPRTPRNELSELLTSPRSTIQSIKAAIIGQDPRTLSWNEIGFFDALLARSIHEKLVVNGCCQ